MRKAIAIILVLLPIAGYACTIAKIIDPECERNAEACTRRELHRLYENADVVYEVTVQSVHRPWLDGWRRSLNRVEVEHIWKTDDGALEVIEAGWGRGDCTISLSAGQHYVVFGHRRSSAWSFLPWVKEVLYAGMVTTFTSEQFRSTSIAHGELYMARTPEQLAKVLSELE
jgi:hypothetical protein